jgi:C4-type Zn-finger protein
VELDWTAIRAALQAKVVHHGCPACQHDVWGGATALITADVLTQETPTNGHRPLFGEPGQVVYLPMTCDRCGYTRLFDVNILFEQDHASG